MKKQKLLWLIILLCFTAFFVYSMWIAPFSVKHGYIVGASKLMAEGLIPWHDFNIMDMPLGFWIYSLPYRILGVSASGNVAVFFILAIHLINLFILDRLLKKMQIQSPYRWVAELFYLVVLYSTDAMMVSLEPLTVFFLLLALLVLKTNKLKGNIIFTALFYALAVFCSFQAIVLLPVFALIFLFSGNNRNLHWKSMAIFLIGVVVIGLIFYIVTSSCTNESLFWNKFYQGKFFNFDWNDAVTYLSIYAGRFSVFFLLPGLFLFKWVKKSTLLYSWISFIAILCISLVVVLEKETALAQLVYPFVFIAFALILQDCCEKKKWMWVLFTSVFLIPGYLCGREFQKFDYGEVKAEQNTYLDFVKESIKEPTTCAVMVSRCHGYDLGPQVLSEIPNLHPVDMKHTQWGLIDWEIEPQNQFVMTAIDSADILFLNEDFLEGYGFYCMATDEMWAFPLSDLLSSHETMAVGELYMVQNQ